MSAKTTVAAEVVFYDIESAAVATRLSKDTIAAAIRSGRLRAKRTGPNGGGKHLMTRQALMDWFEGLADA